MEANGCIVGSLIFDGCLVRKHDNKDLTLKNVNALFQNIPKYKHIQFIWKEFEDIVDTSVKLPITFIRHNFNNNYFHQLPLSWDEISPDDEVEFQNVEEWCAYKNVLILRMNTRFAMALQGVGFQKTVIIEKTKTNIHPKHGKPIFPGYGYSEKSVKDTLLAYSNQTITVFILKFHLIVWTNFIP